MTNDQLVGALREVAGCLDRVMRIIVTRVGQDVDSDAAQAAVRRLKALLPQVENS